MERRTGPEKQKAPGIRQWVGELHPLVRLYIYFICGLFVVLAIGPVFIVVKAQYLVAGGLCLVPVVFVGTLVYLARREMNRRVIPGGYNPIKGDF